MSQSSIQLHTLGCRLNEAELESWARGFERAGLRLVQDDEPADLVVINTCAVTGEAARKSRQILRRCHRQNPQARLIISGCLAALEPERLAREAGVDLIVSNADKDRLVEIALETLAIPVMPELAVTDGGTSLFRRGRQRAFIKVQDGCRYQCTFCVTTQARGDERSRPADEVIQAVRRLHEAGIQEVVLAGVHLGGYGGPGAEDLSMLIRRLLDETEVPRIRLGSLEPWDLPDRFWALFAEGRLMPHLHLPLQSGSDAVLKRMARRCKAADFVRLVEQGRDAVPDLNVTTDIIVGFPGETDADWRQTAELSQAMRFGHIHAFAYSPRAGTLAAGMSDRVDAAIVKARSTELQRLARAGRMQVLEAQVGKQVQMLVEGEAEIIPGESRAGYTPNYLPVLMESMPETAGGRVVEVRLTGVDAQAERLIGDAVVSSLSSRGAQTPSSAKPPKAIRGSGSSTTS